MKKITVTIRPFNLNPDEYEKMFESSSPDSLMIVVFFNATADHSAREQHESRKRVKEFLPANSETDFVKLLMAHPQPGMSFKEDMFVEHVLGRDFDSQKSDPSDVIVPFQIDFSEGRDVDISTSLNVTYAMNNYDQWVRESGSIEPKNHDSSLVSNEFAVFIRNTSEIPSNQVSVFGAEN